ncbi:ATP-dependent protease ATPase subunit HslU [Paraliomyxa miuraensis]|uniref:ATP-dependent protease ATPase subunit HslU n=1 Tax=Paraliomyxa miuraensis TaxID=376150 RepID=UPI00225C3706|nr:ATP-dependent protease ATPase subunit HslU [Paraliomyxa miuraensis]MCX4242329.1 ATP-dependent protease ATPase subunit HslU [Paraliomyxa miuraensis]
MAGVEIRNLTPRMVVDELDRYVIGQNKAKRAVAIAMRNRWRRQMVEEHMREEISPKNIIMVGPTGVGKTEIARRLAKLSGAPFVKVEVSKFTEVGYVGRDVDSVVRDLVEQGVSLVRSEMEKDVRPQARTQAEERLLDLLLPGGERSYTDRAGEPSRTASATREKLRELLRGGKLDEREVEVEVEESSGLQLVPGLPMGETMGQQLQDLLGKLGRRKHKRKLPVSEAMRVLVDQEAEKLVDREAMTREAVRRTEQLGVVFLDEIDKICSRENVRGGDVSREGVQRDLLPLVEGTTVATKYGPVKTDHVLFIAAGAFHLAKVSDLIPELQGRFPIRVELESLDAKDFVRILREPDNSLLKQYAALLHTEGVALEFDEAAIDALADAAWRANASLENIGARRLHTVMERVLEELSFEASELGTREIRITAAYVHERVDSLLQDQDLSRHIL